MRLYAHRVEPFDNGMYLLADDRGDAILIDPSRGEREALATIREQGLKVIEILNTHGHWDHVYDNTTMKEHTGARLAIHRADAYRLDPATRRPGATDAPKSIPDDLIEEGPLGYLRDLELRAIHTPGPHRRVDLLLPSERRHPVQRRPPVRGQRRADRSARRRCPADGGKPCAGRRTAAGDAGVPRTRSGDDDRRRAALAQRLPLRLKWISPRPRSYPVARA